MPERSPEEREPHDPGHPKEQHVQNDHERIALRAQREEADDRPEAREQGEVDRDRSEEKPKRLLELQPAAREGGQHVERRKGDDEREQEQQRDLGCRREQLHDRGVIRSRRTVDPHEETVGATENQAAENQRARGKRELASPKIFGLRVAPAEESIDVEEELPHSVVPSCPGLPAQSSPSACGRFQGSTADI